MTYGYGPRREWSDDDPDTSDRRRRRAAGPPPAEPPTSGWAGPPRQAPRIPHPPPPARHLNPPGGQPGQGQPASAPPWPASPAPARRPAPPNNSGSIPTGYPAYPPPVPTSPTVPRAREQATSRGVRPAPPAPRPPMTPGRPVAPPRRPPQRAPAPKPPSVPARQRAARIAEAVPGLIRNLPHHKPWMIALSLIAVVVVVATCGLGSYLLVKDGNTVVGAEPLSTPTVPKRDITSRASDPQLLTAAVVFPDEKITVDATIPPYERIGNAQELTDCKVAAIAELGKQLVTLGCNQVVRATYKSTEGTYLVTAGVFNLTDAAAASEADEAIRNPADPTKPVLSGYVSGTAARPLGRSKTQLASSTVGHFVIYAVIARADGKAFTDADDAHVKVIVYDILEKHLRDGVLAEWAIDHSTPGPSKAAKVTPTP